MVAFALLLTLAAPQGSCKPQFAPLQTGSTSGGSTLKFWRKEEAGAWGGAGWLGWTWDSDTLQPVELIVRDRPKDSPDDDSVTVESVPDVTFAVRCLSALTAGPIRTTTIVNRSLQYDGPLIMTFATRQYGLYLESSREDLSDAQVIFTDGRRKQVLYSADGFTDDPHYEVVWAGDLDGDGQLDLIVNLHRKYSWQPYRLLLSSLASKGQLVGDAALFETGD